MFILIQENILSPVAEELYDHLSRLVTGTGAELLPSAESALTKGVGFPSFCTGSASMVLIRDHIPGDCTEGRGDMTDLSSRFSGRPLPLLLMLGLPLFFPSFCRASGGSMQERAMLHPMDAFTARTLGRNEWVFNFPLSPGWIMWGVTDKLTVELDAECWLGGVPSFNARYRIFDGGGCLPSAAFESMYQYLPDTVSLIENCEFLTVRRTGSSWYNRLNMSWRPSRSIAFHLSPGITWSETVEIDNGNSDIFLSYTDENVIEPDFSAGVSWLAGDWFSLHGSYSHGVTFVYLDNVPGKRQLACGTRVEPFHRSSSWFLRRLGAELGVVSISFPRVEQTLTGPVFYLYWQYP